MALEDDVWHNKREQLASWRGNGRSYPPHLPDPPAHAVDNVEVKDWDASTCPSMIDRKRFEAEGASIPITARPARRQMSPVLQEACAMKKAELSELVTDLRNAVQRSVEKRREVEEQLAFAFEARARRQKSLRHELAGLGCEIESTRRFLTSNMTCPCGTVASIKQGNAKLTMHTDAALAKSHWTSSSRDEPLGRALQQLSAELHSTQQEIPWQLLQYKPALQIHALLGEVSASRTELITIESKEQAAAEEATSEAGCTTLPANVDGLADRVALLQAGQAALEAEQQVAQAAQLQAGARNLAAQAQLSEWGALEARAHLLNTEERALERSRLVACHEATALRQHYEQRKECIFAYAGALQVVGAEASYYQGDVPRLCSPPHDGSMQHKCEDQPKPKGNCAASDECPRKGVGALIHWLAHMFGWPQVAFLHLDIHKAGRLTSEGFGIGLLLGAGIDYAKLTGLKLQAIFTAIDRCSLGAVSAADLAACHPELWRRCGQSPPLAARQKLRALPWAELGGANKNFEDADECPGRPREQEKRGECSSTPWTGASSQ